MQELDLIENGAMVLCEGRIEAAGPEWSLKSAIEECSEVIDAQGRVVTPGLIDAHAHPVFGGNRAHEFEMRCSGKSYEEIATSGGGIRSTVAATRESSEDELLEVAKKRVGWFLSCGTTCMEAKTGYGLSVEEELKMLRVIRRLSNEGPIELVPTFLGAHAVPPEYSGRKAEYVRLVCEQMIPRIAEEGLAEYCDAFLERGYFDEDDVRRVFSSASSHGLRLRLHADQLSDMSGAGLAAELGAVTADHLEQTDSGGIRALASGSTMPVLLPGSVYALGLTKYPRAREMIAAGCAVALATDFNPGSSPVCSLPFVMSLACTQMGMLPSECLAATTINAAFALGQGSDRGSLVPGKRADFVIWDCHDWREIVYWVAAPLVWRVYVGGVNRYARP